MKQRVYNACDLLDTQKAKNLLSDKRLGLISNSSAITRNTLSTAAKTAILYNLSALFGAEHGFYTTKQAGGYDKDVFTDKETGVPVYDLFGGKEALEKAEAVFRNSDAVLFDLQDIGIRYYTYQYTLLDALFLCKKTGIEIIILDRINPLGGLRVEGNCIEKDCISEVGRVAGQPTICGMTIGELALWYNSYLDINANIEIIRCEGLDRGTLFEDTDLSFAPPSPNMPDLDTVFLYAGTCLFEGTNLSEGRGTQKPFKLFGAPWLEPKRFKDYLYSLPREAKADFSGIKFTPCEFTPIFSDYKGEKCYGLELCIKDKNAVNMYATGLHLISALRELYPEKTVFNEHLVNLTGTKKILKSNFNATKYLNTQSAEIEHFLIERKKHLIY